MIEIAVKVCGDHWLNPEEVEHTLAQIPSGTGVMINMSTEGASMSALGIDKMIDRYLLPEQVWVRSWANSVEQVPYHRAERHFYSHFFWMAQRYWAAPVPASTHEHRFACFIGRPTWPRIRMLWDLKQHVADQCLFSVMDMHQIPREDLFNLDRKNDWVPSNFNPIDILGDINSLDGRRVADQYDPQYNTNLSLLSWYHKFDIEIAAESYCHGPAFLPTEKVIRPLLYRRPIMVYGPRHFLRNLRDQGFQTWSQHWDEGYDDLEGPDRWQAMLKQIKMLTKCDHFDVIFDDYQSILDHNRERALEIGQRHQPQ